MPRSSKTQLLSAVNQRLKRDCYGVAVQLRGNRLYLRATLPPAPGSVRPAPYQQQIALHLLANPEGIKIAEAEARLLGARLTAGKFDWGEYREVGAPATGLVCDRIDDFKRDLLYRQGKPLKTWELGYWRWLRQLPQKNRLTAETLIRYLENYPVDSASRFYAAAAMGAFARFCGLDFDAKQWRGSYSSASGLSTRVLPSDSQIVQIWSAIDDPEWRWVFGMMAAYGLRNHEVMRIAGFRGSVLEVGENTKTGAREVWPCLPEWFEQFGLGTANPPLLPLDAENVALGRWIGVGLRKRCPIQPYNLRHAWAVRTMIYGWPIELAARQMGHSVQEHSRTYHRWLNAEQQQRVFDDLRIRHSNGADTTPDRLPGQ